MSHQVRCIAPLCSLSVSKIEETSSKKKKGAQPSLADFYSSLMLTEIQQEL